ncbi:MAG: UxaA family hydrolase, partial [Bacillota bacterium]
ADNVATATEDIRSADVLAIPGCEDTLEVLQDIPFGHKVALSGIRCGQAVIKYGQVIGSASRDIAAGEHVHVHNVQSRRGRGDIREEVRGPA